MEPLHPTDPSHIGRYRLTARLGAGGMGQVYLARTPSGRTLVVKVIHPELAQEEGFRTRFAREADAARRVGGFHTAQVVDADPHAEAPWIATAHIPGPTLERAVRDHGPITQPALHVLAVGLAEGLDAIHTCDLVHRDLKPANIILADDGPRIIDFGIARPLDADSMTTHGAVFGTLPYMSPEQTNGSRVGPASDMFSLGTVLAYAATGTNPFSGATMAETVHRLISPPPDPGDVDVNVRDLVIACWNHHPDQRPNPDHILVGFKGLDLDGSWPPPHATGPSWTEPTGDSPSALPDTGILGTSSPRPPGVPSPDSVETELQGLPRRTKVIRTRPSPEKTTDFLRPDSTVNEPHGPNPGGLSRLQRMGILVVVVAAVIGVLFLRDTEEPDPTAEFSVTDNASPTTEPDPTEPSTTLNGHEDFVWSVAFSPDGSLLATGSTDETARLWDTNTGEHITTLEGHEGNVTSVAFSPDGNLLATGGDDNTVRLWDTNSGEHTTTLEEHEGNVTSVAFSPDGNLLATGSGGTARLWNTNTGEHTTTLEGHEGNVTSVAFSPDGNLLATGSDDHTVRLWDTNSGEHTTTLEKQDGGVNSVAFSPNGTTLAVGGSSHPIDGTVQLWDIETGEATTTFTEVDTMMESVAFSPDSTTLAAVGDGYAPRLWNIDTGALITTFEGHEGNVTSVAFSPDGSLFATGGTDGTARLWSLD
ncbi:WD40 repeat domain-containing serine/threonine protein kinase [Nocardiopsis sp. CA-288880]|uniref:WD40 repeat domain-containing serine/threonine protein kinase n=1 Tax=Nocardiopsis sp. CA-288880 TaxID=3239995 RepID=UPI003D981194